MRSGDMTILNCKELDSASIVDLTNTSKDIMDLLPFSE